MNPSEIAVTLRRRSPWEACDLGLAMLRQWWRQVYGAHLAVGVPLVALVLALTWIGHGSPWIAIAAVWWLKPLYDRVVLHVLSRAVFGEIQSPRTVLAQAREWLGTSLVMALTLGRIDLARSFNLPVRQLEGLHGGAGRRRREVLGRRLRGHAVWLSVICLLLEVLVLMFSLDALLDLFVPAKAAEGLSLRALLFPFGEGSALTLRDAALYATAVLLFEPVYVAAGFGLYLNRRILLEGWDLEVTLRAIAEKRAVLRPAAAVLMCFFLFAAFPSSPRAQERDPKAEMAEVLKDPQFGHWEETTRFKRRSPTPERKDEEPRWGEFGGVIAKILEVAIWIAAIAAIAWVVWRLLKALPAEPRVPREAYRPPAALFGLELAPETLPADVAGAAEALAREGRVREALSLLYRGTLSELVHKRNVELLPSHTEGEALRLAKATLGGASGYFDTLVGAWSACAYARRLPRAEEIGRLATEYRGAFA